MIATINTSRNEEPKISQQEKLALVDLPPELLREISSPGWSFNDTFELHNTGRLDLQFAPIAEKTRIIYRSHSGPVYMLHPIYTDPRYPEQVFVYTIQLGDGMVQGDRYFLNFTCEPGSAVHITSQSATKIFRMEEGLAYQGINLLVKDGAFVEYLPDPVIPFRDSRCYQCTHVTVAPTATLIIGEILLPGRVACGERHHYTLYRSDMEASRPDGTLLFADKIHLTPRQAAPQSPGRLGTYDVLGSLYLITNNVATRDLVSRLRCCLASQSDVLAGVSELPNGCGVCVRMLSSNSSLAKSAFHLVWNEARMELLGIPAPDLRKC